MSISNEPGQPNHSGKEEVENLSADDLDVQELDDKLLEKAAGGAEFEGDVGETVAPCASHCNNNVC